MDKSQRLNALYTQYGLSKEDVFRSPQGWVIITRSGIDKIQANAKIDVSYDVISVDLANVVIKATGNMGDKKIESFGEANPKNTRNSYPIAMAEKRAMARVVLKLSGFYAEGVFSEDEADDFAAEVKKQKKAALEKPDLNTL